MIEHQVATLRYMMTVVAATIGPMSVNKGDGSKMRWTMRETTVAKRLIAATKPSLKTQCSTWIIELRAL
jgi:hypothetical protein